MKPNEINLESLNAEQLAQLEQQLEAKKKAEKARIQAERDAYTDLVDTTVRENVKRLQELSNEMARVKEEVFASFEAIIQSKEELFKVKVNRKSDTFTTSDGMMRIKLGYRTLDSYNDTVNAGLALVEKFLATLAKDENSAGLVGTIMSLLSKNQKGDLNARKVLELEKLSQKYNDKDFVEGIRIIKEAYNPTESGQFISVEIKNDEGKMEALPLSIGIM